MILVTLDLWETDRNQGCEKWFRRAMDASPYNYDAGLDMMSALHPRWTGNPTGPFLEFGRQALATRSWITRLPLLLRDVHKTLAQQSANPVAYWKQPEVWADLKTLYQGWTAYSPKDRFERTYYAVFAFRAEDWATAHAQMEILGDQPDASALGKLESSRAEYLDNRREVEEHLEETAAAKR